MSNAERQHAWRERLKARASVAGITDHVRHIVDQAILALWSYHERPGLGRAGFSWHEIVGCSSLPDYIADLMNDNALVATARAFLPHFDGFTRAEARALAQFIQLADIIALRQPPRDGLAERRHVEPATPPNASRRRRSVSSSTGKSAIAESESGVVQASRLDCSAPMLLKAVEINAAADASEIGQFVRITTSDGDVRQTQQRRHSLVKR